NLRLNVLPDASPKNTMNRTTTSWPTKAAAVIDPASNHSDRSKAGLAGGGGNGAVASASGSLPLLGVEVVGSALFKDSAAACSFSYMLAWPSSSLERAMRTFQVASGSSSTTMRASRYSVIVSTAAEPTTAGQTMSAPPTRGILRRSIE